MTVHHWGENPAGTWTLEIADRPRNASISTASYARHRGRVLNWSLVLYGIAGGRLNHHGNSNNEVGRGATAAVHADDSSEQAREVGTSEVKQLMEEEEADSDSVQVLLLLLA